MTDLHIVGVTEDDGKLWHTIRFANQTWQPFFGDVKAQETNDPGPFYAIDCAGIGGDLHIVGITEDGKLWHTLRFANQTWQSFFGDVKAQMSNDPGSFLVHTPSGRQFWPISCAGIGGDLHILGSTVDGKLWHTIRFANQTWQPFFGDVKAQMSNDPGHFTAIDCADINGDLHFVGATGDGKLWHTIRFADQTWQPFFGDVKAQESNDPGNDIYDVGCAAVSGNLHIVFNMDFDGKLWHTIRFANQTWQSFFGDVKAQESNDPGRFFYGLDCGGIGGDLHMVGITEDGKLWHTIRLSNQTWQPFFGDVKAQESNNPGSFFDVGCASVDEAHDV